MPQVLREGTHWLPGFSADGTAIDYPALHPQEEAGQVAKPAYTVNILQVSGRWLLAGDVLALGLAFLCGGFFAWATNIYVLSAGFQDLLAIDTLKQVIIFTGLGALALLWLDTKGHYRQRLPFWETTGHILKITASGFVVGGFIQFAAHSSFSRLWVSASWVSFGIFLFGARALVRRVLQHYGKWEIPAILIGEGPSAESFLHTLTREPQMGFTVVRKMSPLTLHRLVEPQAWKRLMNNYGASHLFLALEDGECEQLSAALKSLMRERLPCSIVPPWSGLPSRTMSPHYFFMQDVLLLHDTNRLTLPLPCFLKRSFDVLCAGLALLMLAPLFALVAFIVRLDGGPAFFKQERIGRNGKKFSCYKFRSMRADAETFLARYLEDHHMAAIEWQQFQKLKNDVRITPFGQFIRRSSIDELPQLVNVLRGDMSLVGPRPITPGQEHYYGDDFIYYQSVRPGITGLWQVSGRNALTFKERVALECCYARNWSLWMDIVILLKTLPVIFRKEEAF